MHCSVSEEDFGKNIVSGGADESKEFGQQGFDEVMAGSSWWLVQSSLTDLDGAAMGARIGSVLVGRQGRAELDGVQRVP